MKKIYMILAAMTLLSMSLNAQLLPSYQNGGDSFTSTGKAYPYTAPRGMFRMPTLNSGEYLFGPYTTDDFDETGIGYYNYYNQAQQIGIYADMTRAEFEEHVGDTIIGFRFALAGSTATNVYNFQVVPASDNYIVTGSAYTWDLGQLMGGNTGTSTVTAHNDITIIIENGNFDFRRIAVETTSGTTVTEWNYTANNTNLPNSNWTSTNTILEEDNDSYWMSGGGTITISAAELAGVTDPVRVVIYGKTYSYRYYRCNVTVNGSVQEITNYSTWSNYTWGNINPTTTTMNTVEVGRGATRNEKLPVSGYNMDYGFKNQMIYRAGQLAMANGAQIRSLTFYPEEGIGIPFSGSTITVSLANVSNDNFGTGVIGNKITEGLTTVATITPVEDHDATEWTINFDTPFTYTGGNLLVQMACPGNGDYAHAYFLGDNQSAKVSLISTGRSANTSKTGTASTFLPKATFGFTGNVNTPTYLALAGGEWHDFFLEDPVVFNAPADSISTLLIGYTYYQQYSSSHTPVAYNSNSLGHDHHALMYASNGSQYVRSWWRLGASATDNTFMPGDLAVQLIFKKTIEKTDAPTITYSEDDVYGHITATAPASDPDAVVTLTVNGTTVTGTGSVTINIGRTGEDVTVTASATAQATDKLVSDPTDETFTVHQSILPPTPTPDISSQVLDLTVQVTGEGEGEVIMYIDGQKVNNPYYLERTDEEYTVTVTVTALITDGEHRMSTTTETVVVPPLANIEQLLDGWTQLPGTYTNDKVINWNDNLMFIDRFTESTAQNDHPVKYIYKMTENGTKLTRPLRETNQHIIPVMKTGTRIVPYYPLDSVTADTDHKHVKPYVMNAKANMTMEESSEIYYYTLDRSVDSHADADYLELTNLQNDGAKYVEVGENYKPQFAPYQFGEVVERLDSINNLYTGTYGTNFMTYVPIVWTLGNLDVNKRANWDNDFLHNSYGAPIWMTGAPQVRTINLEAQMQRGPEGSTQWEDANGNPCSLYFLGVEAYGDVPATNTTNIQCEPYMFRVWIQSPGNNLRGCTLIPADPNRPVKPGEHWEGDGTAYGDDLILVYEGLTTDGHLVIDVQDPPEDNQPWSSRIQFGAIDNIPDLQIYIRFYYKSEGDAIGVQDGHYMRGNRDGGGYGAGDGGGGAGISTGIMSVYNDIDKPIDSVTFVNAQGMTSDKPFDGINIVITRYTDGSTRTTKVVR